MLGRTLTIATAVVLLLRAEAHGQSYKSFTVKAPDGVNISVQEWGNPNGKEIIFIHGFMQSHLSWRKQVDDPEMQKQFRMITYDLRGHGGSDKIMDPSLYNNGDAFALELSAVMQAASLQRPIAVGWSYGTGVISDYLIKYGSSAFAGINFVGGVGNGDPRLHGPAMRLIPMTSSEDLMQNIETTKVFIRNCFEKQPTPEEFELILAFNMVVPPKIRRWLRRSAPYEEALRAIAVPSVVTHGTEDKILTIGVGRYLVATVPGAKPSFYDGVGHSPFWEDAPRFNRELIEFANRR